MNLTPHGPGFSFLDSFEVTLPGTRGRGRKWLDPNLSFFAEHFPGKPLMPGVLLIECGAQTAGALWSSIRAHDASAHFTLAQIVQFKIQHPVMPGETVETNVVLENTLGSLAQFDVTLTVQQTEVARGRLVLSTDHHPELVEGPAPTNKAIP
jgi:3-hydroxyacyl-[acyl-carrier-protein] dehydratase